MTEALIYYELTKFSTVRFESIENRAHNPCFPDVVFFKPEGNGTIELKACSAPWPVSPVWQAGQIAKNVTLQNFSDKVYLLLWNRGVYYLLKKFKRTYESHDIKEALWTGTTLNKEFLRAL